MKYETINTWKDDKFVAILPLIAYDHDIKTIVFAWLAWAIAFDFEKEESDD